MDRNTKKTQIISKTDPIQAYADTLIKICPELNSDEINFMCNKVTIISLKANTLYHF